MGGVDDPQAALPVSAVLGPATDRIDAALDRQSLIDATIEAIAPFGFVDIVIARMERRDGFGETAELVATFPEFLDYVDLDLKSVDPTAVVGQSLEHPVVVPFDLAGWRSPSPAQLAALTGRLGERIGTRIYLPGTPAGETTFYGVCFSGGGPGAGEGLGEAAMLWSIGRVAARRLARLDGREPGEPATGVPVARVLSAALPKPLGPEDSGLIARQRRLMDRDRPPAMSIIRPRRRSAGRR